MKPVPLCMLVLLLSATLFAGGRDNKPATQKQPAVRKVVDSGSFGIYVNGRRIGTEKFHVEQGTTSNLATSEVTVEDGATHAVQGSELEITSTGALLHYRWHEDSPEKALTSVEPNNEFLIQRTQPDPNQKAMEQPYVLPATTPILDDYFFVHREILAWRYLASICEPAADGLKCKGGKSEFGVLIPHQHTSVLVQIEANGAEKLTIGGAERDLQRFTMTADGTEWQLWLDENHKLVRALSQGIEALRD